jgi:hypothetical protein
VGTSAPAPTGCAWTCNTSSFTSAARLLISQVPALNGMLRTVAAAGTLATHSVLKCGFQVNAQLVPLGTMPALSRTQLQNPAIVAPVEAEFARAAFLAEQTA